MEIYSVGPSGVTLTALTPKQILERLASEASKLDGKRHGAPFSNLTDPFF